MKGRNSLFSGTGQSGSKEEAGGLGTVRATKNSSGTFSGLLCLPALPADLWCLGPPDQLVDTKANPGTFPLSSQDQEDASQSPGEQQSVGVPGAWAGRAGSAHGAWLGVFKQQGLQAAS